MRTPENDQNAPLLVLIPGTGGDERIFCEMVQHLRAVRVLAISHIHEKDVMDTVHVLKKLFELLSDMNIIGTNEKFHLLGTSVGGRLAQYYAQEYPEDLLSLIIGNSYVDNSKFIQANRLNNLLLYVAPASIIRSILYSGTKKTMSSELFLKYFEQHLSENSRKQLLTRIRWNLQKLDPPKITNEISKLLIISKDDPLISPDLRVNLRNYYPEAKTHEFENAGHFSYVTMAKKYAVAVMNFIEVK